VRLIGLAALVAGCATTIFTSSAAPADAAPVDPPRFEAPPASAPKPRVALVLSGGAARAFAHLGVLRVLEREGLRPDLVVGTSAGAIVGAYFAAGLPVAEIEVLAARIDWPTLIDIDPVKTLLGGLGLAKGERLEAFLRRSVGCRWNACRFPSQLSQPTCATAKPYCSTTATRHARCALRRQCPRCTSRCVRPARCSATARSSARCRWARRVGWVRRW
jgi:predicted acylesterase/phospholipase RssA